MLNPNIFWFENSADPDQLAYLRSQLIRILTVYHSAYKYMLKLESCELIKYKLGRASEMPADLDPQGFPLSL